MKLKDFQELTKDLPGDTEIMGLNFGREFDIGMVSINTSIRCRSGREIYYKRDGDGELEKHKDGKRVTVISVSGINHEL